MGLEPARDDYPHLRRAPITEALVDIQIEQDAKLDGALLDAFAQVVKDRFPERLPLTRFEANIDPEPQRSSIAAAPNGFIHWNPDHSRAVQARPNGFTFNHIRDYDSWTALRNQAAGIWAEYRSVFGGVRPNRIGLRYINRIEMPPGASHKSMFRTRIELGSDISGDVEDVFLRTTLAFGGTRKAVITEASLPGSPSSIILDIDAFSRDVGVDDDAMWIEFEALHRIKNQCFFGSLESSTVESFR